MPIYKQSVNVRRMSQILASCVGSDYCFDVNSRAIICTILLFTLNFG